MVNVDVLYVVGGPGDREDLRYSLRTVEVNLRVGIRDLWIVGDVPGWFRGCSLHLTPLSNSYANQRQSLTAYLHHPDAADRVILFNDDMFVTETVVGNLPIFHLDSLAQACERVGSHAGWPKALWDMRRLLTEEGHGDVTCYEAHVPLVFDVPKLRDLIDAYPADRSLLVGQLYNFAGAGGPGVDVGNAKVGPRDDLSAKLAQPMPFLSCNPETWTGVVGSYIRPRYTTPSRWEKPMLNADMIRDQKRSPGLVENPCRDALIDLASKVPVDEAIVELGSYMGRSTAHLALGSSLGNEAPIHAFDPWEKGEELPADYIQTAPSIEDYRRSATREAFEQHMKDTGADAYVTAHQTTGVDGSKEYDGPKVGLLFHDAIHDEDSVFADLKAWLPHMAKDAVVVLHDTDDVRYGVEAGAEKAFTRTKALREKWDWDGRENHPWAKNDGKALDARRRGFVIVRTRS